MNDEVEQIIPSDEIGEIIKQLLEIATGQSWTIEAIDENWDCFFKYECPDGIIKDFSGSTRYIEGLNYKQDPRPEQWALQFAHEAVFYYMGRCFDHAKGEKGFE